MHSTDERRAETPRPNRIGGAKVASVAACLLLPAAVSTAEFETRSWPGEGIPVLIARYDGLELHQKPRIGAPVVTIPYKKGWKVPFDQSIYRTIRATIIDVQSTKTIEIYCDSTVEHRFSEGEKVEYLQYAAEGYGTARVAGRICQIPIEFESVVFGTGIENPETEWWVRVTYRDGTSPGWLNVSGEQISFGLREF